MFKTKVLNKIHAVVYEIFIIYIYIYIYIYLNFHSFLINGRYYYFVYSRIYYKKIIFKRGFLCLDHLITRMSKSYRRDRRLCVLVILEHYLNIYIAIINERKYEKTYP